jgi:hypothetical protein
MNTLTDKLDWNNTSLLLSLLLASTFDGFYLAEDLQMV